MSIRDLRLAVDAIETEMSEKDKRIELLEAQLENMRDEFRAMGETDE